MHSRLYKILLAQCLGLYWDTSWPYPYEGQVHEVMLVTWPLNFNPERLVPTAPFASRLEANLAEFPDGSWEYELEQRYIARTLFYRFRTIPIGWGNEEQRTHAGGKEEAEQTHQTLVYYLDQFMLVRRLFDDLFFEEMCESRRAFLAECCE
jgi:hypothetical protein